MSSAQQTSRFPYAVNAPVDFFKEEVTLSVDDSVARVSGVYYFRNNGDSNHLFTVAFPFYVDSLTLYPSSISAYVADGKDAKTLEVIRSKSGNVVRLSIPMTPKGVTVWHLDYAQSILAHHARYILTTTGSWGQPLKEALYKFITPASFDSVRTWPAADSVTTSGDSRIYWSRRVDFMPRQDMEIFWERK